MISYIFGHKDRLDQFKPNLDSLYWQSDQDFEIIISDSSENSVAVRKCIDKYRNLGLKITAFKVDPMRCKWTRHSPTNFYNPALQQNVAARLSKGDIIVLTSPEVVNAQDNVQNIKSYFSKPEHNMNFLLGWTDERDSSELGTLLYHPMSSDSMRSFCSGPSRNAHCKEGNVRPYAYFIGAMLKSHFMALGGIEEKFMQGLSREDSDFSDRYMRYGMTPVLSDNVTGIHLTHPRTPFQDRWNKYLVLPKNRIVANEGHEWGSLDSITEYF